MPMPFDYEEDIQLTGRGDLMGGATDCGVRGRGVRAFVKRRAFNVGGGHLWARLEGGGGRLSWAKYWIKFSNP